MTAVFKPALGAVHACAIPPAAGSDGPGADDVLVLSFVASRPTASGAECELWTNLPSDDPASWDGTSWRDVTFVDRPTAIAPPPDEAVDWPLLSLSEGESPPLLAPAPTRQATLRIPLGELSESRHFEYTYRLRHPDGGIEWLGDGGSNGKLEILVGSGASAPTTSSGGRWKALASKAFVNGASSGASKASREWSGGEGRLGVSVGPGAEWAGFGISWEDGLPVAQTLPAPHGILLPVVVLHTVDANTPTFQVTSSLVDPGTPHIIAATDGGVSCEDDSNAEPSSIDDGHVAQKELVLKAATAKMTLLVAAQGTAIGSDKVLTPLWTSGPALTALYHPSRLVIYSSTPVGSAFPAAIGAPAGLSGPMAVYSARTDDVVILEPGKGLLLNLPKQQDVVLESLDVVHLREVVDAVGKPTDILFGPLKAAFTAVAKNAETGCVSVPSASSTHDRSASGDTAADQASTVNGSEAESDDGSQDDEADDTMVAPAEPSSAGGKTQGHADAAKASSAGEPQTLFGRLFALVWKVWSSVLGVFGLNLSVSATSDVDRKTSKKPEPTERTPLLASAKATNGSKVPTSAPVAAEPAAVTRYFTRLHFSELPAQAIISVPASASFPTRLQLFGRPLHSTAGEGIPDPTPTTLAYKAGRVEELAKDKDGRSRRFWRVDLGEAAETTAPGEWEVQAWVEAA